MVLYTIIILSPPPLVLITKKYIKAKGKRACFLQTKMNKINYSKCNFYVWLTRSVVCGGGAPLFLKPKAKVLKILAFKSSSQNNSGGSSGSKTKKESIKVSIVPQGSEETSSESPRAQNLPISYPSETVDTPSGTLAIQNIFKHWLAILRTPSPNQAISETVEGPSSTEAVEPQNVVQQKERGNILEAVWSYFIGLDATIKINLLIL